MIIITPLLENMGLDPKDVSGGVIWQWVNVPYGLRVLKDDTVALRRASNVDRMVWGPEQNFCVENVETKLRHLLVEWRQLERESSKSGKGHGEVLQEPQASDPEHREKSQGGNMPVAEMIGPVQIPDWRMKRRRD